MKWSKVSALGSGSGSGSALSVQLHAPFCSLCFCACSAGLMDTFPEQRGLSMISPFRRSISSRVYPWWDPWTPLRRSECPSPWWPSARTAGTSWRSRCTDRHSGPPSGTSRRTSCWSTGRTPASARCRPLRRCSSSVKTSRHHEETRYVGFI